MNRAEKAALQLRAVAVLRTLKQTRTYEQLSSLTGLPPGDLNRSVNGHVLPGAVPARTNVTDVERAALPLAHDGRVRVHDWGHVSNAR